MRNPKRIPEILKRLQKLWEKNPDLRLGQLIENVYDNPSKNSAYLFEDEAFISKLEIAYGIKSQLSTKKFNPSKRERVRN